MPISSTYFPQLKAIKAAAHKLKDVANITPLVHNVRYSKKFECTTMFKREDLQVVRSYKIRGAYNRMSSLTAAQIAKGIVCASAGNHALGVALSSKLLKIQCTI